MPARQSPLGKVAHSSPTDAGQRGRVRKFRCQQLDTVRAEESRAARVERAAELIAGKHEMDQKPQGPCAGVVKFRSTTVAVQARERVDG